MQMDLISAILIQSQLIPNNEIKVISNYKLLCKEGNKMKKKCFEF